MSLLDFLSTKHDLNEESKDICQKSTKKKKKRVKKAESLVDWIPQDIIVSQNGLFKKTDKYFIYSINKDTIPHVIGIDIGTVHLAISGLNKTGELCWISLISQQVSTIHEACDYLTRLLWHDQYKNDFIWIRNAPIVRIELQHTVNPPARIVATVLRSLFNAIAINNHMVSNVEYVHGDNKYKLGPLYDQKTENNPIRSQNRSGSKGKPLRKQLAVDDVKAILHVTKQKEMIKFLEKLDGLDQIHDICDSFLIGLWFWHEKKSKRSRSVVKRKRLTKSLIR